MFYGYLNNFLTGLPKLRNKLKYALPVKLLCHVRYNAVVESCPYRPRTSDVNHVIHVSILLANIDLNLTSIEVGL